jgi:hypothetical protein
MGAPIPNDALQPSRAIEYLHFSIAVGVIIFGAIHVATWNFDFPTPIERILWRMASVLSTALLPVMYLNLLINEYFVRISPIADKDWTICFGSLYLVARLFRLAEIFRTFICRPTRL